MAWAKAVALLLIAAAVYIMLPSPVMAAAPLLAGGSVVKPTVSPMFGSPYTVEPAGQPVPANFSTLLITTQFPYLFTASQNGAFSGSVTSSIWQDPTSKDLAFSYSFNNLQTPLYGGPAGTDIVRVTLDDPTHPWFGFNITDSGVGTPPIGHSTPQGSTAWNDGDPFALDRDATFQNPDVQFRVLGLGTALLSATSDASANIWFATSAQNFTKTNVGFLDGGNTGSSQAYAPAAGVFIRTPEPSSWILMTICGGVGLLMIRRRRRGK
jgi:hypothetical protein